MAAVITAIQVFLKTLRNQLPHVQQESDPDPEGDLVAVPTGILKTLSDRLGSLPTPQPYQKTVQQEIRKALQAWQSHPDTASNCAVVLCRPVEDITSILKDSLEDYLLDFDVQFFLTGYQRSQDPLEICGHLQREIDPDDLWADGQESTAPITQDDMEDIPKVVVIPSLEQCFLRCIQGWSGIEFLQSFAAHHDSRFWVFGCSYWAWAFLDKVCQIGAYIEHEIRLPKLGPEDLQEWLKPLLELSIQTQTIDDLTIEVDPEREGYWGKLADLSSGISTTAAHLWLDSLRVNADQLTEEGTLPGDADYVQLIETKPKSPSLKTLEASERYILHSLLIHRELTRSHLAMSLGESERTVRSQVQVLRHEGIVNQRGRYFSVDPAHYPKICDELSSNNFLIGEE